MLNCYYFGGPKKVLISVQPYNISVISKSELFFKIFEIFKIFAKFRNFQNPRNKFNCSPLQVQTWRFDVCLIFGPRKKNQGLFWCSGFFHFLQGQQFFFARSAFFCVTREQGFEGHEAKSDLWTFQGALRDRDSGQDLTTTAVGGRSFCLPWM